MSAFDRTLDQVFTGSFRRCQSVDACAFHQPDVPALISWLLHHEAVNCAIARPFFSLEGRNPQIHSFPWFQTDNWLVLSHDSESVVLAGYDLDDSPCAGIAATRE